MEAGHAVREALARPPITTVAEQFHKVFHDADQASVRITQQCATSIAEIVAAVAPDWPESSSAGNVNCGSSSPVAITSSTAVGNLQPRILRASQAH